MLITGASSGIGAALARELATRGARLALCARRVERLAAVARDCRQALVLPADLAEPSAAEGVVRQAHAELGRLDAVVLNAGYGLARTAAETSDAEWQAILRVNLLATAAGLRAAVPLMRAQQPRDGWRGRLVIVSSSLARRAVPDTAAYSATKAAQLALAEAARVELAAERIAVCSVHPVRTETEFFATCERISGRPLSFRRPVPTQSAERVARCIAARLRDPPPEIWPHAPSRWLALAAAACPRLADRVLAGYRR
ncbi:MAG: SDR family oxidoreductase [Planctomycetes bacterium]|nr:SDR family oxidoreductase [Planctomycetota bacterium]